MCTEMRLIFMQSLTLKIEGVYFGFYFSVVAHSSEGFLFWNRSHFDDKKLIFLTKSFRIVHFQLILLIILAKSSIFRDFFLESLTDYFRSRTPLAEGLAA